jgi:hypothetical protein
VINKWKFNAEMNRNYLDPHLYFYEMKEKYLRKKNPTLIRTRVVIIRRRDNQILGELIRYGRGGGDLPSFGHPSSFSCPDPVKGSDFENSIFIKGDKKD